MPSPKLVQRVLKTIKTHNLFQPHDFVLVAVSGGPDSVALLNILIELQSKLDLKLAVVHYEHGIRGQDSLKDAEFVKNLAAKFNLPFYLEHGKALEYARNYHLSLEAAARELRYNFFERMLKKTGATKVALAHTADDQVEEILRRIIRGTAWIGLSGMAIKRGPYVRPLLEVFKDELLTFLKQRQIPYVIDKSNLELKFLRNKIRHQLIPLLLEFNPGFKRKLLEMSRFWQWQADWLQSQVSELKKACIQQVSKDTLKINLKPLENQDFLKAIFWQTLLQETAFEANQRHLNQILKISQPGGAHKRLQLPDGWYAYKEADYIYLTKNPLQEINYKYVLTQPGRIFIAEIGLTLEISEGLLKEEGNKSKAYINPQKIRFPLEIRPYQPGDKLYLNAGKPVKLKDLFIKYKIPYSQRRKFPVILSHNQVVWVAGLAVNAQFKAQSSPKCLVFKKLNGKGKL